MKEGSAKMKEGSAKICPKLFGIVSKDLWASLRYSLSFIILLNLILLVL